MESVSEYMSECVIGAWLCVFVSVSLVCVLPSLSVKHVSGMVSLTSHHSSLFSECESIVARLYLATRKIVICFCQPTKIFWNKRFVCVGWVVDCTLFLTLFLILNLSLT